METTAAPVPRRRIGAIMNAVITRIDPHSPSDGRSIRIGDTLVRINGRKIGDVLDYKYYAYEPRLLLELRGADGRMRFVRIRKRPGEDLGLSFEPYLMDAPRACANRCVFCFVDQLPQGMRETLYFKDDDVRLSFLQGNYVTLTNLSEREIQRIIDLRLSPLNISVHATDPQLHSMMLGHKNSARALDAMRRFAHAGIVMNCQIVVCPGLNDGAQLDRSLNDLAAMYPSVVSVSVVPVGLTKHREGLTPLTQFDQLSARETLGQTVAFGDVCLKRLGTRFVYPADELYIKADAPIPDNAFYEDYPQLENGVGLIRLLMTQTDEALETAPDCQLARFSIATGAAAAECLQNVLCKATVKCDKIQGIVYTINNRFFGASVDVTGLITGGDLIAQLRGKPLGDRLLISEHMLRSGEHVFLDDVTVEDVSRALGVPVRIVERDGADLIRAMYGN